jgi:hypothetical protein
VAIYNFVIDIMRENIPSLHDPHANEDNKNGHEQARWEQLNRTYSDFHDNENNITTPTPTISDNEDDLYALLDLPPLKPEGMDIIDDNSKITHAITEIDTMGDIIVMHKDVVTTHTQGLHTGVNEEGVDKTHLVNNIENASSIARGTSKPPGTATIDATRLHTREMKEEENVTKEELPADDKALAKYEYEGKPNVQDNINIRDVHKLPPLEELPADNNVVDKYKFEEEPEVPSMPPQEELPADNGVLTWYKYSYSRSTVTSQMEILDVAKKRNKAEPADLEREEPTVRENPYSINETHQEEEIADHEHNNGVATKK